MGLVIGLERGWRERERADGGRVAGLRTFALAGVLGGVFALLDATVFAAALLALGVLAAVAYRENVRATRDLSATSVIALLLTVGLGGLATRGEPTLALAVAVLVAVWLNLRSRLHGWLRAIEARELGAALQLLVLSAVVLPVLPDVGYGPFDALNPYRLWWAVVLVAGLGMAGHVAVRSIGPQRGTVWAGVLGGLASSTVATLAMARRVREQPALLDPASAGALGACAVMSLRIALILLTLAPSLGRAVWLPLVASAAVLGAMAALWWPRGGDPRDVPAASRPVDLDTAVGFGAFLAAMSVATEAARALLGEGGLYALSLMAGVADVDAITLSVARMESMQRIDLPTAATAVGLAVLSNMAAKTAMAAVVGGRRFGLRFAGATGLALAAGVLTWSLAPH